MSNCYPPHCIDCNLYATAKTYKCNPLYSTAHLQEGEYDRPGILVVTSTPDQENDWDGMDPAMRFLKKTLNCTEVPWTITGALRCAYNGKMDLKKIRLCSSHYLPEDIRLIPTEIGCIVGCGEQALRGMFPESSLTLDKARQGMLYYTVDGMQIPVIFTNHPSLQYLPNDKGKDLRKEYASVFRIAERICLDDFPVFPQFQFEEVNTWKDFDDLVCRMDFHNPKPHPTFGIPHHVLDIEQAWHNSNPERPNSLHPGAYVISLQFSWRDQKNQLRVVVVDTRKWDNHTVYRFLMVQLKGKNICGSNLLQYDLPAICARAGYHWSIVKEFWGNLGSIYDSYVYGTCVDQESTGNGLKNQAWNRFRVPRWDSELDLWKETDEAKQLRRDLGRPLDYGDYPWDMLKVYAALDAYWNLLIVEDYPELFDPEHSARPYYDLQVRGSYAACMLSLTGIPVDPALAEDVATAKAIRKQDLQGWLNRHPFAQLSGKPGEMSASSPKQSHNLLETLRSLDPQVAEIARNTTDSGMWQLDDKAPPGKQGILSRLAAIPTGVGVFFTVLKEVREITGDTSKILMPMEESWPTGDAYLVPHHRLHPEWKVVRYDNTGTDSGRWANKPNVHNTKSCDMILAIYVGYQGGRHGEGWICDE